MYLDIFLPPRYTPKSLDLITLNKITSRSWMYAPNGRASIFHLLKPLNITTILVPVYICETVLIPLKKLNIKPIFYDLDIADLNASLDSIKFLAEKYNVKTLLIASIYGNPANLIEIEKYCSANNIFLIDDAAQSFGAKLDNKYIGTYGNAGFFSFSPGKPTAGHMGSFFWSEKNINIRRTNHCFVHYLKWLDFNINRYNIYNQTNYIFSKTINLLSRFFLKITNTINDDLCKFENELLGGILADTLADSFSFRNTYQTRFEKCFSDNQYFRVIKALLGEPNNHKLVLVFHKDDIVDQFTDYMFQCSIYAGRGYHLLSDDLKNLPNALKIRNKVVELPIEDNIEKMNYLFEKVAKFNAN